MPHGCGTVEQTEGRKVLGKPLQTRNEMNQSKANEVQRQSATIKIHIKEIEVEQTYVSTSMHAYTDV